MRAALLRNLLPPVFPDSTWPLATSQLPVIRPPVKLRLPLICAAPPVKVPTVSERLDDVNAPLKLA